MNEPYPTREGAEPDPELSWLLRVIALEGLEVAFGEALAYLRKVSDLREHQLRCRLLEEQWTKLLADIGGGGFDNPTEIGPAPAWIWHNPVSRPAPTLLDQIENVLCQRVRLITRWTVCLVQYHRQAVEQVAAIETAFGQLLHDVHQRQRLRWCD